MRIAIQFDTENAAFDDPGEVERVVARANVVLAKINFGQVVNEERVPLMDTNGKKIGFVSVTDRR